MRETRIVAAPVEVREAEDGTATIVGYAATFNEEYEVYGFTESIDSRAFNRTLKNNGKDLAVVWSHDADRVLGTVASGTARFAADAHGLSYEADLDLEDPDGKSAWRKITTGKVTRSSFSFEPVKDEWEERDDAPPHRRILEAKLYEASPVLFPANPGTDVDVKRAVASYAEYRGVDIDADSIEQVRNATTSDSEADSGDHSATTQDPEPARYTFPVTPGLEC